MADKTVTIKSADGDYTTLNAALAGEDDINADLTATGMNGILTFECWNFEDTTKATTGTGYTTDSTHYLNIIGRAADKTSSNTGKWSTDRYRIIVSTSVAIDGIIQNEENYTRFTDLQVATNSNESPCGIHLGLLAVSGMVATRCLVYAQQANTGIGFSRNTIEAEVAPICAINCIAIGGWGWGFYLRGNTSGQGAYTYSCTAYGCAVGFRARSSYCYAKNCLSIGCTDAFLETSAYAVADYCCFDEGTDPGTNGTDLSAYTDDEIFVDADNATVLSKDCHLCAGSQAIGRGVDTSGEAAPLDFTTDIDGQTRTATWDCGADEYVTAGGTTAPPTTLPPTTLEPTTIAPTTIAPTTLAPTTLEPTTIAPTTLPPTTLAPTTLPPTTLPPTTVAPTTLPPTTLAPTTAEPTTPVPTTPVPTTLPPTTIAPTTVSPTTIAPTTAQPTTIPPTTPIVTTLAPTTLGVTTLAPTSLPPTTIPPTTVAPTTVGVTTLAPTTLLGTTLPPTTLIPTTVGPTTEPPVIVARRRGIKDFGFSFRDRWR